MKAVVTKTARSCRLLIRRMGTGSRGKARQSLAAPTSAQQQKAGGLDKTKPRLVAGASSYRMRKGGLEPPRVASHAPQTCASTSSATSAWVGKIKLTASPTTFKPSVRSASWHYFWAGLALDSGLAVVVAGAFAFAAGAAAPPSVCCGDAGDVCDCWAGGCAAGVAVGVALAFAPPSIRER